MTPPPPVTFFLQDVPALYGAERVTLSLLSALRERGVAVDVLFIGETRLGAGADAFSRAAQQAGLPVRRLTVDRRFSLSLIGELRRHLKQRPGSILHTVGYKAHLHAVLASRGVAASVTTIHGWLERRELKERCYEWLEVQALRHDEAVICLSRYYEEVLRQRGVRPERLHRIPTGLEPVAQPTLAQASVWPDGPFTVALVGRLSSEKNHDVFLRAVARLRKSGVDVRGVLAGDGPEKSRVLARIRELGLTEMVQMIGYAPMAEVMPAVHAVCLCSHIENLPLSLMEAMAWQRPIVATRVGGIPDVVEDQITGLLVPDDDEEALANALQQLESNPVWAQKLGRAGRQRVEQEFIMPRCVDRHVELYRRLAG